MSVLFLVLYNSDNILHKTPSLSLYIYIYMCVCVFTIYSYCTFCFQPIGTVVKFLPNGSGDQGSIPGQVIPKIQEMVLDAFLLNT